MSLVRLENITKTYAGREVLDSIDFRVEEGEHVGLIGRNGTGKSTIFRLITGDIDPDKGIVDRMKRMRVSCLSQLHKVDETMTIYDIVLESFEEILALEVELGVLEERMSTGDEDALHEYSEKQESFSIRGGYDFRVRIKQVLQGLGFAETEFSMPFMNLSGGQRTRLMLALVLLEEGDLLLLDEPENHLDLEAREWLESYLKSCPKSVVIISHDRQMLNNVVDRVVELERGEIRSYPGNYDSFLARKTLHREQQQVDFERQQEFIRKEQAWIDRFRYKNTKAKQVQSRIKRLEKLDVVNAPLAEASSVKFKIGDVARSGELVLEAKDLSMGYGGLTLYKKVSFTVCRGERVGIVGPNGTGKTTLLCQLAGQHPGLSGEVSLGHKVIRGFYEQNHESLNPSFDILTEVHSAKVDWTPEQIRSYMGRFLFTGDDVFKSIDSLSGGELSRVAMAKLLLGGANLLLLDEPTNHLDIVSREALEKSLTTYEGAIIVVSHDRTLIDKLVEKLIIIENGIATVHLGNYSDYRYKNREVPEKKAEATEEVLKIRRGENNRKDKKTDDKERRKIKQKMEKLEQDIESMEGLVVEMELRFTKVDPTDYATQKSLKEEYDALKADLGEMYRSWESLAAGESEVM
jgi:ATP-binding cassette subfamily F protein 3